MEFQMEISVLSIEEHDDGSATCHIDMDEETKTFLINIGFVQVLKNGVKEFETEFIKDECVK